MEATRTISPPATDQPLPPDDPRATFGKAVGLATTVIGAVRPDQLEGATPCPGLDVRHLLGHLVTVLQRVAALGRGDDPFALPEADVTDGTGWAEAWLAAAHQVQDAWTDAAVLERGMTLPWMTAPGGIVLIAYVSEVTVHTWDLATATGQAPAWDDQVLEAAYSAIHAGLPAEDRLAVFEAVSQQMPPELRTGEPPFAEAVPVPPDAPLLDRLVAWTGRRP